MASVLSAALALLGLSAAAHATVEPNWPAGKKNPCKNATDGFMDFELGTDLAQISSTIPGAEFTTTKGLQWAYADIRSGNYNIRPYGTQQYETNGNFFAWLGTTGDVGRITFAGGPATYVSLLTSTDSGLQIDAFDAGGNLVATSGRAGSNVGTGTFTRLTVEAPAISYVEIHDSGNFWLIDDLCTDAPSPCQKVAGLDSGPPNERIDLVFVPDDDYNGNTATFDSDLLAEIQNRLGALDPIHGNLNRFNFYFTHKAGDSHGGADAPGDRCGASTLPAKLLEQCPFADAFVVLHTQAYGDCTGSNNVYSSEGSGAYGDNDRTFVHESGHALFGLWDEYDDASAGCPTGRGNSDSNVWTTQAACRTAMTNRSLDPNACYQFTTCAGGRWKVGNPALATDADRYSDPTLQFIMLDGTRFNNGYGAASIWWINNSVYPQLGAKPALPSPIPSKEKSLELDITVAETGVSVTKNSFVLSPAPNYFTNRSYPLRAIIYASDNSKLGEFGFDDPRIIRGEPGYTGPFYVPSGRHNLVVPYFWNVAFGEIRDASGALLATVDLSQWATGIGPTASAGGPYTGDEGVTLTLDASASTGDIVSYEWDINGDGNVDVETTLPVVTYKTLDEYTGLAYVRVTSSDGSSVVASTPIAIANVAPTVDAGADVVGVVGDEVHMAGSFTDPGSNDKHSITWIWGDGATSTGSVSNATHTYAKQGTYTVTLRVTDDDGGVGQDTLLVKIQHNACVLATRTVEIKDRGKISAAVGAGFFSSDGNDSTLVGDAVVNGNGYLGDRSVLDGSLTLAGTVQRSTSATVTNGVVPNAKDVQLPSMPTKSFPVGKKAETIKNGANVVLAPGTHGSMTIRSRATVTLQAGEHNFASLFIEPDVRLVISGAVNLNVQGDFQLGDRSVIDRTGTSLLTLYTNGANFRIGSASKITGVATAPNAAISVASAAVWTGCVGGQSVVFEPDVVLDGSGYRLPRAN